MTMAATDDLAMLFEALHTATGATLNYNNLKDSIKSVYSINFETEEEYLEALSTYFTTQRPFPCLQQLEVCNAPTNILPPLIDCVFNLHALTELNLSKCPLSTEIQDNLHLWSLVELSTLKLDGVMLTTVPPSIGRLVKLTHLSLSGNTLSSLPSTLDFCQQLETLNISKNKFKAVPGVVLNLKNIKCLRRMTNEGFLSRLSSRDFQEFPHIKITEVNASTDKDSPDPLQSLAAKQIMSLHVNYWLIDSLPSLACKLLDTYGNKYDYCHQCHGVIANSEKVYVIEVILLRLADIRDVPFTMRSCSNCYEAIKDRLRQTQTELKQWIEEDLDKRMKEAMIQEGVAFPNTDLTTTNGRKCSVM